MIESTAAQVGSWMQRANVIERPQPASELLEDDTIWPHHPPSEVARLALVASTEHLQLVIEIVATRHLHATADFTVLRAALVGASTAVWLLGPSETHERQQRALRLIVDWYNRKRQNGEAHRLIVAEADRATLESQIAHSLKRRNQARALWAPTQHLTAAEKTNDTTRIGWAADFTFPNSKQLQGAVRYQWSALSGDAHALGWQLLGRRTGPLTRDPSGLHAGIAQASIDHLAEPYLASFRLLRRGWSLFDQRCTAQ